MRKQWFCLWNFCLCPSIFKMNKQTTKKTQTWSFQPGGKVAKPESHLRLPLLSCSPCLTLCDPRTAARQAALSMGMLQAGTRVGCGALLFLRTRTPVTSVFPCVPTPSLFPSHSYQHTCVIADAQCRRKSEAHLLMAQTQCTLHC